ncbi:MAG TPA: hypothetical protein VLE97_06220 [Gaiellaceae bacterium]|nr:hypothetical protein [Gaiellaceae bacterium]
MATNELGHKLARDLAAAPVTLGAYRGGNRLPWLPGATIDAWVPCARGEVATGVPYPHVYFVQTIGDRSTESGSIHCPSCRAELAGRRSMPAAPSPVPPAAAAPSAVPQSALPF